MYLVKMENRRAFIQSILPLALLPAVSFAAKPATPRLMSVNGWIRPSGTDTFLVHEHVMVDFIGAEKVSKDRYNADDVFQKALPLLQDLKRSGCDTMLDCTPAYLGRDVHILQRLSRASGLHIITNTGYYGASKEKHVPKHAYTETAEQLAARWINEFNNGIEGTGIRPGFIKLSADRGPLTEVQRKLMHAGALTHLATGLTIAVHSGNGAAAQEELQIIQEHGVSPEAFVWIHAQNEERFETFAEMARKGSWIEFDALKTDNHAQYKRFLEYMRAQGLLHKLLLSHDSGWYNVGEPGGGNFRPFTELFKSFIPEMLRAGFTWQDFDVILKRNPVEAFGIRIRKTV